MKNTIEGTSQIQVRIRLTAVLIRLSLCVLGLQTTFCAFANGVLTDTPILAREFVLAENGSLISNSSEVVAGKGSVKGSFVGTRSYNPYLHTDPSVLKLTAGHTYTVTFRYKILATPDKGFEIVFYSPVGGGEGVWLPSFTIGGVAGESGTAKLTNTLGPYADYRTHWNVVGSGSIAIDDIELTDETTGQLVVKEDFEKTVQTNVFANPRTSYVLNLAGAGTDVIDKDDNSHTLVPFGQRMSFAGSLKYSKDTSYLVHHVRSHAETYEDWNLIADFPVDFLRTGLNWNYGPGGTSGRGYSPFTSTSRFPDRADKSVVGYVNSMEFGGVGGWDPSFDPSWDKDGNELIDPNATGLPPYVDINVFNAPWKNYVAAYWTDSWRRQIQLGLDLLAAEHFDGVMFDVMTSYWTWKSVYPSMDVAVLRQQYVDLIKWASNYARTTYGTAFLLTINLDGQVKDYFPDLGNYIDAGYYQNAFFRWEGSGVIDGSGLSISQDHYSNSAIDFIRNQGMSVLDMDHLGTGSINPSLDFKNYDYQITTSNFLKLFAWAIQSGSTPYSTPVFMGLPYGRGFPRFVRVVPGVPNTTNTAFPDWVIGSDQDDTINTGDGDDLIYGGKGNDIIDGAGGTNTAYYIGARTNFSIYQSGEATIVRDNSGVEGTDTLTNIQRLIFSDGAVAIANLKQGWNLIGNSTDLQLNVASILGDTVKVESAWKWIANTGKWAFYSPSLTELSLASYAASKGYDVLATISGGEGFWVNAKAPFITLLPEGNRVTSAAFQNMSSGWHLISTGDTEAPVAFNMDVGVTSLWAWDNAQSKWYFYAPSLQGQGGSALSDYIRGNGYLDFTSANKILGSGVGFWVNKP